MQDIQVQTNITFKAPSILQKYNTKQIQTLLIQFVENLEEKEEPVVLHQIDFKDMNKKEQEAYLDYKKNKDSMKFYNF